MLCALQTKVGETRKTTLIVVQNVSLMEQWQKEITKMFRKSKAYVTTSFVLLKINLLFSLTSTIYHGTNRPNSAAMAQFDIVLTTFGTLSADGMIIIFSLFYFSSIFIRFCIYSFLTILRNRKEQTQASSKNEMETCGIR